MWKRSISTEGVSEDICAGYFYDLSFYFTDITAEEEKHTEVKNNKYLPVKGDGFLCKFSR